MALHPDSYREPRIQELGLHPDNYRDPTTRRPAFEYEMRGKSGCTGNAH